MADLCQLADVKEWLATGTQAFPPTDDHLLASLITRASVFIESWLARSIGLANWQEIRDGQGGERAYRMQLAEYPVVSVQLVAIRDTWGWGAPQTIPQVPLLPVQGTFLNQAGYYFDDNAIILQGYSFSRGIGNIIVQYTAGYNPIPADIQQACIEMVGRKYKERTRIGMRTVNIGGIESVTYDTSMFSVRDLSDIEATLWQYRRAAPIKRATLISIPPVPAPLQLEDQTTEILLEDQVTEIITEP